MISNKLSSSRFIISNILENEGLGLGERKSVV